MKETIRQLITRAQDGDTDAFHDLVAIHDERIMILALQLTRNEQDAEDLYQDVFLKVYKNLHRFRFKSEFFTWVYRITVNTAYNFKRQVARIRTYEPESENELNPMNWIADTNIDNPEQKEILSAVNRSLEKLPQQQRTVFILKHMQCLKIKDIANILGISEGSVKKYLFRAMEKLRGSLKEYKYV